MGGWFSSFCLLRTLATKAMVLAINYSPILGGGQPLEKTVFGSLPAPRLNGARSGVRKDVTRLLPVFRTCSPRRYSGSSPGAHSQFGVTYLACRPRDAMARVNCHANVDSMYESFRFPYRLRSRWDLESMFHSRLFPSLTRSFTSVTGFNYEERKNHPPMSAEVVPRYFRSVWLAWTSSTTRLDVDNRTDVRRMSNVGWYGL